MVVHDERGHPVDLQGDRTEAVADQPGEQFVADQREGRFPVRRLAERQQVAGDGDQVLYVLTHGPQA
ncbi:hypothetical protein [Streptomyces sudanensis]|uniref:hypothetical protein n=1 Tax=Streptomyces sudanensis TaxID=436397 RepID=UPI0023EEF690|nr:hypothetical protein [Streptomyces sudanensis]